MNILETREGDAVVFTFAGDLDVRGARALRQEIDRSLAAGQRRFVIDLASVATASPEGLRVILGLAQTLAATGGVALCNPNERVMEMLKVSGLSERLVVESSRALAARRIPAPIRGRPKTTALLARLLGAPPPEPAPPRSTSRSAVTRALRVALMSRDSRGA